MTYSELLPFVRHEIEFLRYYCFRGSKIKLTVECELYAVMESIGYCKKNIPLDKRCPGTMLCTGNVALLDRMFPVNMPRNHAQGLHTPLEVFWELYPERREDVLSDIRAVNDGTYTNLI